MAANIDQHSPEKDASLQSSVAARPSVARDLDERRRSALAHIDNASFSLVKLPEHLFHVCVELIACSWFHVKIACVAGVGFFTDA
jgi:PHS family inorganic phosphate transporter-like MFS transporter